METKLREAIRAEAFVLHYQPQVRVDTGEVTGVEALIRWPQAEGGFIPPNHFIPVAEQRGLIAPIGAWVLRQACAQTQAWQALVPGLTVSVNISSRQFQDGDLVDRILEILRETGLAPGLLTLELTEGALMESSGTTSATLERLEAAIAQQEQER